MISSLESDLANNSTSTEPALWTGITVSAVAGVVTTGLNLFFPKVMTLEVKEWLYTTLIIFIPVITALITRGRVWAPASVQNVVDSKLTRAIAIKRDLGQHK